MKMKTQWMAVLTCTVALTGLNTLPAHAEEGNEVVVQLINRVGALEDDNRELRGQLDEARHEIKQLSGRLETINSDLDYRLNSASKGDVPMALVPPSSQDKAPEAVALSGSDATTDYEKARSLLEQGDYEASEAAFARFIQSHPKDKNAGAAQYWLGVTYFVRGQHEKAVGSFAKGYKAYPKSEKAADGLLKLAKSLGALDRTADACTTLDQLTKEHPKANEDEVARVRKQLSCKAAS